MKRVALFISVAAGVAYAPVILLLRCVTSRTPLLAPMQFLAADAFYYLSIARHSIGKAFYTSDGLFPTNGFHPLWEWLLTKLFSLPGLVNDQGLQLLLVFWLSIVLVTLGTGLFALVIHGLTDNFALSLLASVPGLYYLAFSLVEPEYNSTWSFINGMETPLVILGFGLLCYLTLNKRILLGPGYAATILLACLLTLVAFSRLDDVFLLIPYLIFAAYFSGSRRDALIRLLILGAIPGISLLLYVVHNYAYADSFVPVSGLSKQGIALAANLYYFILTFIPIAVISSDVFWSEGTMRTLQLFIPVILAAIIMVRSARWLGKDNREGERNSRYNEIVIAGLCLYVILKGVYNLAFVRLWGQGHGYFPLSIMIFNLVLADAVGGRLKGIASGARSFALGCASLAFVVLAGNALLTHKLLESYNGIFYNFWIQRSSIQQKLQSIDPNVRIIEYDDGPISYALDIPTMNGIGYTLDQAASLAKSRGQLLQLAYNRGFRVIGLLYYYHPLPPESADDPESLRALVQGAPNIGAEDLSQWRFSLFYEDPKSRALFIKFEPATGAMGGDAGLVPALQSPGY